MTSRRWTAFTLTAIAVICLANVLVMMHLDVFGLFRDPHGMERPIYFQDRTGKFLLNKRYVPANYDSLLIGASTSNQWKPDVITAGLPLHMYNDSVDGTDSTEEKLVVDQGLAKAHYKLALVEVAPPITNTHKIEDGLDKEASSQALGSIQAYVQLAIAELVQHHVRMRTNDATADGMHKFAWQVPAFHTIPAKLDMDFTRDPEGVRNLQALVAELRAQQCQIVYVIPPLYRPLQLGRSAEYQEWQTTMQQMMPAAPWIDFNAPEYDAFRSNEWNFVDGIHLTTAASSDLSVLLNARLKPLYLH